MNSLVGRLLKQGSSRKYNLSSYIRIEEGEVFFDLNKEALQKIHEVRSRDCSLYIPCDFRLRLLHNTLLKKEVRTLNQRKKTKIYLYPELTFYTCYSDQQEGKTLEHTDLTPSTTKKKLLRSVISLDGDILYQISRSSLQHPYFSEISAAHHWLAAQLLSNLHVTLSWIPKLIWLASTVVYIRYLIEIDKPVIMRVVVGFLLPLLLRKLWIWLQPLITRWVLARILSIFFLMIRKNIRTL
jgi:hypothetical protein